MLSSFQEGLSQAIGILRLLIVLGLCTWILGRIISRYLISNGDLLTSLAFAVYFGIVVFSFISLVAGLVKIHLGIPYVVVFIPLFVIVILIIGCFSIFKTRTNTINASISLIPLLLFAFLGLQVFLRLRFASQLLLPPYSDSPEHYSIIHAFLSDQTTLPIHLRRYYHLGFHSLTAGIALISNLNLIGLLKILPQIIVAMVPLVVFVFVKHFSGNEMAAIFSAFFSGMGWLMPGYAINWGKYPAILGLVLSPLLVVLWHQESRTLDPALRHMMIVLLWLINGMFHTRTLISTLFLGMSVLVVEIFPLRFQTITTVILVLGGLASGIASGTLDKYYNYTSILLLAFLPLAFWINQTLTRSMLIYASSLILMERVPLPEIVHPYSFVLLDRPFVEISLFFPFSVILGLGVSGLISVKRWHSFLRWLVAILSITMVFLQGLRPEYTQPSPCCNFVVEDDLYLLDWAGRNIPSKSIVLIASMSAPNRLVGTDAGIWLEPLFNTNVLRVPYNTDWSSTGLPADLCRRFGSVYIYLGSSKYSFNAQTIRQSGYFEPVFVLPQASLYRITCSP